ncbi:non-hydrolyzing UDP-N-acetylglucosamine 2-epimerase [Spongisporangium articulatum]|uniref:Non-hydrolyzing UDP-N-acetylglucosamine 2-epimerase n=1 Tax=Spongisporangium articulatum TaxID=3362603 RepID=A0ABW8AQ00_9ACTN
MHVTGARPNFPKAAPVIAALAARGVEQRLVHTGQHYDDKLSRVFFTELELPEPDVNLGVGSGSHGTQTAAVLIGLEALFEREKPSLVVVYGDVNSTLAAALAAVKLGIPVAHVEAGLRSFDDTMPEEINRRLTDQICELLFVTSADAVAHLTREGVATSRVHLVGNPMIDTLLRHLSALDARALRASRPELAGRFAVATLHRPSNVDDPATAARLVEVLRGVAERLPVVIPVHPRGRAALAAAGLESPGIVVVEPLPYTTFLGLVAESAVVVTDSGGVQEETTVLGVPCLTMRPNTERPVTITHGTNRLVTPESVLSALDEVLAAPAAPRPAPEPARPPLWDGAAGERIADVIVDWLSARNP